MGTIHTMSDQWLQELLDVQPRVGIRGPTPPGIRLNLGSGYDHKDGWINVDTNPDQRPDVCADALSYVAGLADDSVDEIYAGHFLEHLEYEEGARFLSDCYRVLRAGAHIGVVVPDTRAIMRSYLEDARDLDHLCRAFLYSTVQESQHKWSYDLATLARVLERAGFIVGREIDRFADPRLHAGAWWQCGLEAAKAGRRRRSRLYRRSGQA
jgi:predicted SAM-dependent methyltransferase